MENGRAALLPKQILELTKMGPGKSLIGRSKSIKLIQDHNYFPFLDLDAVWPKEPLESRKVGPGKSWIGKSQAIELIQDHIFFPFSNPGHGNWPGSPRTKRAIRVEKSGSWKVLDW